MPSRIDLLDECIAECRRCPRLVEWREHVADVKRKAFADEVYWGRGVPGFGAQTPRILIVGLAPAAHGANRTGRMFTGDRSGDWLFASLHRVGMARLPTSIERADGQVLQDVRITAAVHCAPPDNKPTPQEFATCATWLEDELRILRPHLRVAVALGALAWSAVLRAAAAVGWSVPRPRPVFGHGARGVLTASPARQVALIGSYHPSQQNTFTGRLTEAMLDDVLSAARGIALT